MLCEMESNDLTSHITRMHCTIDEYKAQFPDVPFRSAKYLNEQSERISGDKNPAYQHGGKYSPFSEKFIKGKDPTIHAKVAKNRAENQNTTTNLNYYLKRGLSQKDAELALSERQRTFSLDKCIQKFGIDRGKIIWKARQEKWLKTLNSKSVEERALINQRKMNPDICISKAEKQIAEVLSENFGIKTQQTINGSSWVYDIIFQDKIIEYHGDYWHCNPSKYSESYYHSRLKMTAKEKWNLDTIKKEYAISQGYQYFVIWESDFHKNPQKIINECICFLKPQTENL